MAKRSSIRWFSSKTSEKKSGGTLSDTLYRACQAKAYKLMQSAWKATTDYIAYEADFPFKDVTGNLKESIGVVLIGKSTKTGRIFALPSYPANKMGLKTTGPSYSSDGDKKVIVPEGTPTAGGGVMEKSWRVETDRIGSGYGKVERAAYLEKIRQARPPTRTHIYNLVVFAAMPYASFVNMKHGREFFQSVIMPALMQGMKNAKRDMR